MKKLVTAALLIAVIASVASAVTVSFPVTGSNLDSYRTTPTASGLIGSGAWTSGGQDGGIEICWDITEQPSGMWCYSYTFTEVGGGKLCDSVCHMLLEVSSSINSTNYCGIFNNFAGANCSISAPQTFSQSRYTNPGLPTSLYAVELSGQSGETFTFDCTHSPMWGSFYAVDNSCGTYVWNSGITNGFPTSSSGPFTAWIPIPDTTSTFGGGGSPVPEPATMALLGLGLVGVLARRKIAKA